MTQERIEAAAKVGYERNVEHLVSFGFATSWEAAHPDTRVEVLAKTEAQLAAADAVMFSDEAIERAAKDYYTEFEAQPIYDEDTERFTGHRLWEWLTPESQERYKARIRFVVAALKGDA